MPQLQLQEYSKNEISILTSLRCSTCGSIIRDSMYRKEAARMVHVQTSPEQICENCYHKKFYRKPDFVKTYKHCVLNSDIISSAVSRKICLCEKVPHYDSKRHSLSLFPVSKDNSHRKAKQSGMIECGLLKLGEVVAETKYDGIRTIKKKKQKKIKMSLSNHNLEVHQRVKKRK
jgi:hypothetical protein